jgi:hypothetical protein
MILQTVTLLSFIPLVYKFKFYSWLISILLSSLNLFCLYVWQIHGSDFQDPVIPIMVLSKIVFYYSLLPILFRYKLLLVFTYNLTIAAFDTIALYLVIT